MITVSIFTSVINQLLPEPQAGLLNGILFGTKAALSPELYDALVVTGTLHIVALSGMNITLLVGVVNTFLVFFIPRKIAGVVTIVFIAGFVLFVGPSPSVIRAAIMGSIAIIGIIIGKNRSGIVLWAVTMILMLIFKPALIIDLSFQLSALASLGMVLFDTSLHGVRFANENLDPPSVADPSSPSRLPLRASEAGLNFVRSPRLCSPARRTKICELITFLNAEFRTTLSAQVFTIPLIFFTFHRVSFISPVTNILIGWTMPYIMVLGMCLALLGLVFLPMGIVVSWVLWIWLSYDIFAINLTSRIPFASVGL